MRHDLKKVICERPRRGAHGTSPKTALRINPNLDWESGDYDYETHEIPLSYSEEKEFNDYLKPLQRFLRARLGRPWNDVYSEICSHTDRRSTIGNHLLDHVRFEVIQRVLIMHGVPYYCGHRFLSGSPYRGFYVDEQGVLSEASYKYPRWVYPTELLQDDKQANKRYRLVHTFQGVDGCRFSRSFSERETRYRVIEQPVVCMHNKDAKLVQSYWFVEETAMHDLEAVYDVVRFETAMESARNQYSLTQPGDFRVRYYKDVPEEKRYYVSTYKQANKKDLRVIRRLLGS